MRQFKDKLQKLVNSMQFRIDTTDSLLSKPTFDYQPLPWVGIDEAPIRGEATIQRWIAIKPYIKESTTLKDIGCCVGYFCLSAADELDLYSIGIDSNPRFLRIANYAKQSIKLPAKVTFLELDVNPISISILPKTDITICFSIWHHWVFHYGLDNATTMLKSLWESTNNTLFFESGEEETKKEFNLPFDQDAKTWLLNYLRTNLNQANVNAIGEFPAGNYDHYSIKNIKRTVYQITRRNVE